MFKSSSIIKTNVAALLVAFSALSFAGDSYIAASVGFVDAYEKVTADEFGDAIEPFTVETKLTALNARLGKHYGEYFAAEVRLGVGLGDDVIQIDGVDTIANLEIRDMYGIYARAGARIAERFYPYALIGYSHANLEGSIDQFTAEGDFGGVSYGIGLDVQIKRDLSANLEYISYFDSLGLELSGFSLGLSRAF
jgi:hypothetical protein